MADASQFSVLSRQPTMGGFTASNFALDGSTDGYGFSFQALNSEAITHLGFRYGARALVPPTYSIRLEGLDTSGMPDNTDVGGGSATAATFTPPNDTTWNGTWQWVALTNSYTPTRGQILCATIRHSSGTIDGSNNSSITTHSTVGGPAAGSAFPHTLTLTAGTWAKVANGSGYYLGGVRTASSRYGIVTSGLFSTTINTAGNRQVMHWTPPAGFGDTFQISGARLVVTTPAAAQSLKVGLWDGSGAMLQDVTYDSDAMQGNSALRYVEVLFDESSLATLSFGTKYYLGVEVVSTNAVGLRAMTLGDANDRLAWPGGTTRGWSTWNGSAWTDDDTMVACVEPIISDWTEPAGGSSPVHTVGIG